MIGTVVASTAPPPDCTRSMTFLTVLTSLLAASNALLTTPTLPRTFSASVLLASVSTNSTIPLTAKKVCLIVPISEVTIPRKPAVAPAPFATSSVVAPALAILAAPVAAPVRAVAPEYRAPTLSQSLEPFLRKVRIAAATEVIPPVMSVTPPAYVRPSCMSLE